MSEIRVGVSGWTYPPWRGNFYPAGLKQRFELAYASRRFNALEINGTFYSLQRPSSFQAWRDQTPADFVFAIKGGRYITHFRKLNEPRQALANFFASGVLRLGQKLGPFLWQFPPFVRFDEAKFRAFFDLLPRDTRQLARLARGYADFLKGRIELDADGLRPVRHAVEFRHASFLDERFVRLLRESGIAMVIADVAGRFPTAEDVTADWVYVRLHGSRKMYSSGYSPREIAVWTGKVSAWAHGVEPPNPRRIGGPAERIAAGRDVFVFFDNTDVKLRAPVDARRMARKLGVVPVGSAPQTLRELDGALTGKRRTPRKKRAGRAEARPA